MKQILCETKNLHGCRGAGLDWAVSNSYGRRSSRPGTEQLLVVIVLKVLYEGLSTLTDRSATSQIFGLGLPTEIDRLFGKQLEVFDVLVTQTHSFFVILI